MSMPPYSLTTPIETSRLLIRPPEMADADAYVKLLDDWEIARWTRSIPHPYRKADAIQFIEAALERWRDRRGFRCTIALKADALPIGGVGANPDIEGGLEIGYWIGRDHWRQGFGGEAVAAFTRALRRDLGPALLFANVLPDNLASRRILNRTGFLIAGTRLVQSREGPQSVLRFELKASPAGSAHR